MSTSLGRVEAAQVIVAEVRRLDALGLLPATSGNLSVRTADDLVVVTPSGVPYDRVSEGDLAVLDLDGTQVDGPLAPSTEVPMHLGVYRRRPEVRGIVHTHAPFSTALACLHREIPPIHYLLTTICPDGVVRLAPYALYGTDELADNAAAALGADGGACLLANHGMLAVAGDLATASIRTITVEQMASIYHRACQIGDPVRLDPEQVRDVAAKIVDYGRAGGR